MSVLSFRLSEGISGIGVFGFSGQVSVVSYRLEFMQRLFLNIFFLVWNPIPLSPVLIFALIFLRHYLDVGDHGS